MATEMSGQTDAVTVDALHVESTSEANETSKDSLCCSRCRRKCVKRVLIAVLITVIAVLIIVFAVIGIEDSGNEATEIEELLNCTFAVGLEFCYTINYAHFDERAALFDVCFGNHGDFINGGTPNYIDSETDCAIRKCAYEYGKLIQPRHNTFKYLHDALQLNVCRVELSSETSNIENVSSIAIYDENTGNYDTVTNISFVFYVNPEMNATFEIGGGSDLNDGRSIQTPFLTIEKAIEAARSIKVEFVTNLTNTSDIDFYLDLEYDLHINISCTINLLAGTYYLNDTIKINNSWLDNFLTIQNYNGDEVIISGGKKLIFDSDNDWYNYSYEPIHWKKFDKYTNMYGPPGTGDRVQQVASNVSNANECLEHVDHDQVPQCFSLTFDNITRKCYCIRDRSWQPVIDSNFTSMRLIGKNIWSRSVSNINEFKNGKFYSLRVNNKRGILARFPDSDPEINMQFNPWSGWIGVDTNTTAQGEHIASYYTTNNVTYKDVDWPMNYPGTTKSNVQAAANTGMADWGDFQIGSGGQCDTSGMWGGFCALGVFIYISCIDAFWLFFFFLFFIFVFCFCLNC